MSNGNKDRKIQRQYNGRITKGRIKKSINKAITKESIQEIILEDQEYKQESREWINIYDGNYMLKRMYSKFHEIEIFYNNIEGIYILRMFCNYRRYYIDYEKTKEECDYLTNMLCATDECIKESIDGNYTIYTFAKIIWRRI